MTRARAATLDPREPAVSLYAIDDSPRDLCGYEGALCDECGEPGDEIVTGLCERCRCVDCGSPAAPIEHDGARLCRCCATDRGVYAPIYAEAAE